MNDGEKYIIGIDPCKEGGTDHSHTPVVVYKCDFCKHKRFHQGFDAPDDYSEEYCTRDHWFGLGEPDDIVTEDPWKDCEDFSPLPEDELEQVVEDILQTHKAEMDKEFMEFVFGTYKIPTQ